MNHSDTGRSQMKDIKILHSILKCKKLKAAAPTEQGRNFEGFWMDHYSLGMTEDNNKELMDIMWSQGNAYFPAIFPRVFFLAWKYYIVHCI